MELETVGTHGYTSLVGSFALLVPWPLRGMAPAMRRAGPSLLQPSGDHMAQNCAAPALPAIKDHRNAQRNRCKTRTLLEVCALLFLASIPSTVAGAETVQHKVLEHITVTLTISPASRETRRRDTERTGPVEQHRLAVVLRDAKTAAAIRDAHVEVDVAERGYAGADYPLTSDNVDGIPGYSANVPIPGRALYRILVHIRVPRVGRALEAQFEYRHHH